LPNAHNNSSFVPTVRPTQQNGTSSGLVALEEPFIWSEFSVELNGKAGVSAFNVRLLDNTYGSSTTKEAGLGFFSMIGCFANDPNRV
jgi:hypothetical protein